MAQFKYQAVTNKGKKVDGVYEAGDRDSVADYLHAQGLTIISIQEDLAFALKKIGGIQIGGIPLKDKVIFAKQLAIMLTAGVPITQAMSILVNQAKVDFIRNKLTKVFAMIQSGTKLSEAFAKEDLFFNEIQINLMAAGEKSGNLNQMMERIAVDLEKSQQLQGKIRGAMIYPAVIFVVLIVVMAIVVVFMVPSVQSLYNDLGAGELPAVTQLLVSMSSFITNPVGAIFTVLIAVVGIIGFRYYYSTTAGRVSIDKLLLRIPVFGDLNNKIQLAQFCRLLAMLIESGVPIVESIKIVAKAQSNVVYRNVVMRAAEEVTKGAPLSVPLAYQNVFPDILVRILATGEQTGKLDQVLRDMGGYYSNEVDEITNNLTKLMEPIILLIVGGMVGFIAVAVYLPIYSINSTPV